MLTQLRELTGTRFSRDIGWSIGSQVTLAVSGLILNIAIGTIYGLDALGAFNQVYAVFIIASQFASFGSQYSILKHTAEFKPDPETRSALLGGALMLNLVLGSAICGAFLLLAPLVARLLDSPDLRVGLLWAAPGLWCFTFNKSLLAYINGRRQMRLFSVGQASRYLLVLVFLVVFVLSDGSSEKLPLILSAAEFVLLIGLGAIVLRSDAPSFNRVAATWVERHVSFGGRGFVSGAVATLNARVDLLMLGFFATDEIVGVYSVAALFVEGFNQLAVAVRNNLNPVITELWTSGRREQLSLTLGRTIRFSYMALGAVALGAALLYPLFVYSFAPDDFDLTVAPFLILLGGRALCIGYVPVYQTLVQSGFPGWHSVMLSATIASNIALNAALIPRFAEIGAAVATSAALIGSVIMLRVLTTRRLGVSLWP